MPLYNPPGTGSGAPTTADYLVGTADAGLSAEIVVGTTPGGELGGTWASPTVDATHSGSTHDAAVTTHEAASDPHTGYLKESDVLRAKLTNDFVSAQSPVTTMGKATELDTALATGTWVFEYHCMWQTSATATAVKFGVNFSGTATRIVMEATGFENTTAASTGVLTQTAAAFGLRSGGQNNAFSTTVSIFGPTATAAQNVDYYTVIRGLCVITVTGNLELYFGSEATGSTQTLELPTSLIAYKIA